MTPEQRAEAYYKAFPNYPKSVWPAGKWLLAMFNIGNNYKGSGYHGAYPPQYPDRVMALFPDKTSGKILHLFSGSLPPGDYVRCDINPVNNPDVCADAEHLSEVEGFTSNFDIIFADPPYTDEDANKYGYPMINRNKVVAECRKCLKIGGILLWLDMTLPMYRKAEMLRFGSIGIERSTNHRYRQVACFERIA